MKTLYITLLTGTALLLTACKKTTYVKDPGQLVTPIFRVSEGLSPFTGALDIYPCAPGTTIYYGNYTNNQLSPFYAMYTISSGDIYNAIRPVTLPVGSYNLIYWGVSQTQEPAYTDNAVIGPRMYLDADLTKQYYSLRKYSTATDTTYHPVYDFVFGTQTVDIGTQSIAVTLRRVVASLTVILKKTNNSKLDSQIASINVLIGNISEHINFDTGEPTDPTKTVRFPLTMAEDSLTATSPVILVFPSAPNPTLKIVLTLKDGSERTFRSKLDNTLTANTMLTVTVNMGDIFTSETEGGGFQVDQWKESNETVTPEQVS